jgi:3-phenylpropionate/trans-cinnamate dioxygenase ferredoxin reductase subunit
MATGRCVIVGAGLAGAKTAEALRARGFDGELMLLGAEPAAPYDRPPLSKEYLQGKVDRQALAVHEPDWYATHDVHLRTGVTVTGIDRGARQVRLAGGERIGYDKLALATGSSPRRLPIPGAELAGVHYLRTVGDSARLRAAIAARGRLVIVGAGWIGLEVAAAARIAGGEVTVVEAASLPLMRVLGDEMGRVFAELHRDHGVDLRLGTGVAEITGEGRRATGVRLSDGSRIDAGAVLIAVGAVPNTALAEQAGLAVDDGVRVDAALRSSDPDIVAAGDIARTEHPILGASLRVEHWATALGQPVTAAATMLGEPAGYTELPYFFTDQYELGMEYLGHLDPEGYERVVVRGEPADGEFLAFWTRTGRVLAGMSVNVWDVTDDIAAIIRTGTPVDGERLADPQVPLKSLALGAPDAYVAGS